MILDKNVSSVSSIFMQNIPGINDIDIGKITSIKYMTINSNSETMLLDSE